MGNHDHLMVDTPDSNVSAGMRHLIGVYTQRFNRRHRRVGHVFQGRFKAIVVERQSYLLELCRNVVLNPVQVAIAKRLERYPREQLSSHGWPGAGPVVADHGLGVGAVWTATSAGTDAIR